MSVTEVEPLEQETVEFKRFDLNGQISKWKKESDELTARGGDKLNRSISEYQIRSKVQTDWIKNEQECDAHNISEAFRLAQEAESEKERKPFERYYKRALKEISGWSNGRSKPIIWDKSWDVE